MVILGVDPGLAALGWGVIEHKQNKQTLVGFGCIITPPDLAFPKRLLRIQTEFREIIQKHAPDEIAFEELFFSRNVTTALTVGAARGVCVTHAAEYTGNVYEYTPKQVKQALTGYGHADKKQIQEMVKLLLSMDAIPKPDDAADALAVALTHAAMGAMRWQFIMK
ncbi:MAG: crossover junction endodeoxyribonuclease RuvC [Clostridiales bacterium]|nr:crossover junction endodeoxyribonuclease RuvC [Clostridiales bacterium]